MNVARLLLPVLLITSTPSPLLAPSHAGLAPAFIQVQGLDPLRDEGILYEKLLREAGVPTRIIQYVRILITLEWVS